MWLPRWRRAPRRPSCAPTEALRRPRLTVEALEDRSLPSVTFQFTLDDPSHLFAPYPLLTRDLQAAGQVLASDLGGQGTIEVVVKPNNSISRSSGSAVGVVPVGSQGGMTVYENTTLAEAQTGRNPNGSGPEIELDFNTQTYLPTAWFDPSGAARSGSVPSNQLDFISVATHEMTHALGFQGYRAIGGAQYGQLPSGYESVFDSLTRFGAGGNPSVLYFVGPEAEAVYGGPVPLTSVGPSASLSDENFFHVGNPQGPGAELAGNDLMNGVVFRYGTRYTPSQLDLAMLADMGWSVNVPLPPPFHPAVPATGDVSGLVAFLLGPRRMDRRHHRVLQTVLVVNVGGQSLLGPLTLVLVPSAPAARGAAARVVPAVTRLPVPLLAPGQAAVFMLTLGPSGAGGPGSSLHLLAGG